MPNNDTNDWLTDVNDVPKDVKEYDTKHDISKRSGNLLYLGEIASEQEVVLKKFIGIRKKYFYNKPFYCIDYLDEEKKYKRIAFKADSDVGEQFEKQLNNHQPIVPDCCIPRNKDNGSCEYTKLLIKRWAGTSIYFFYYFNDKNESILFYYLLGNSRAQSATQSRENKEVAQILEKFKESERPEIQIQAEKEIIKVFNNNELIAIIGRDQDENIVSIKEKELIWSRFVQLEYNSVQNGNVNPKSPNVLNALSLFFHRTNDIIQSIIEERRIYHDADPDGTYDLSSYIYNIINDSTFIKNYNKSSFICSAHTFDRENNGVCQLYSYEPERTNWQHLDIKLDNFASLSTTKLLLNQTDITITFNLKDLPKDLPDNIFEYITGIREYVNEGMSFSLGEQITVWFHSIGRKTDGSFSAFFLIASENEKLIEPFKEHSNRLYDYIVYLQAMSQIEKDKQINKKSSEMAETAIMARNMSHNLGSHVMAYIKHSLSSVDKMIHDNVLAQLSNNETDGGQSFPFLLGLGHFLSYLQERQDFIATIATDYFPNYSTVNFKDHIYDELNPDKRYQRHKEQKKLEIDNILIGNIAQSEGLGRKISPTKNATLADIVLKFRDFNGDTPNVGSTAEKNLEEMRRYDLSLPGGIVGRQAIFSIIENVIRNAAKHGSWRNAGKLELTFDIYDYLHDKDSERISKTDKIDDDSLSLREVIDRYYFSAKDKYDNYIITLTDNLPVSKESLGGLRSALSEAYIDPLTGMMNNGNKGIKEMRISAAWLRAIDEGKGEFTLSYMSNKHVFLDGDGWQNDKHWYFKGNEADNKLSPLLYARISKSEDGNQRLQYIFCVPIPKKVAIVSESLSDKDKTVLYNHNWRIYSPQDFLDIKTDKSFEFIILDDWMLDWMPNNELELVVNNDLYNKIRQKTSSRLIRVSDLESLTDLFFQLREGTIDYDTIKYDEVYRNLYEFIADYQKNDRIAIQDKDATARHKGALQSVATRDDSYLSAAGGKVSISDGVKVEPYIYRTHHDSKSEFLKFMRDCAPGGVFQNFKYVEGIFGNNSTGRLVRNEEIDDIWFYKHLHAMKTKVAIFDERIFSKVFGLKESDFYEDVLVTESNIREVQSAIANKYPEDIRQLPSLRTPDALNKYLKSKGFPKECDTDSNNFTAKVFEQKNIYIYNLIRSKANPSVYYLVGLKDFEQREDGFVCHCGRIASLFWDKEEEKLAVKPNLDKIGSFDFDRISIHQGLLDKLYTAFGIRNHDNEVALKEKLSRDFYQYFARSNGDDAIEIQHTNSDCSGWFLPGMAIHSGRSKPSEKDMPQLLPFIQYASIEHAVFDCKLSLVELLDFARYE